MSISIASRKQKGRRLQQKVRDLILKHNPELEPDDVRSTGMGQSGEDIQLSPAARKKFPFSVECKNQEKISIWACLKQAEKYAKKEIFPLLIFKRNDSKTYVTLEINDFFEIINKNKD